MGPAPPANKSGARPTEVHRRETARVVATIVGDVATNYFNLLELDMELEIAKRTLRPDRSRCSSSQYGSRADSLRC